MEGGSEGLATEGAASLFRAGKRSLTLSWSRFCCRDAFGGFAMFCPGGGGGWSLR